MRHIITYMPVRYSRTIRELIDFNFISVIFFSKMKKIREISNLKLFLSFESIN
jgi:hypothetical protein